MIVYHECVLYILPLPAAHGNPGKTFENSGSLLDRINFFARYKNHRTA
jgi:hypothetical protein